MLLKDCRVGILGLGLMGGSLGLALRGKCRSLSGHDREPEACRGAVDRGAVDRVLDDPSRLLREADLVVLATPVGAILELLRRLAGGPGPDRLLHLLDLGSTKARIVEAMAGLPEGFSPVGGHPMCGKDSPGIGAAEGGLFQDRPFVLTPLERTRPETLDLVKEMVAAAGARRFILSPESHDRIAAVVSHAPYLVASALAETAASYDGEGVRDLAASGLRDTTRIAASDVTMMLDVLLSNPSHTLEALERVENALGRLSTHLRRGDREALRVSLDRIRSWREGL